MITISKKVEYCLWLINFLTKKQKRVSLKTISISLGLPYRFLAQLAANLKQGGVLNSKEGKDGGYCLTEEWRDKNLYDLMMVLGENKHLVECLGDGACNRKDTCKVKNIWQNLENDMVNSLKKIKINQIE